MNRSSQRIAGGLGGIVTLLLAALMLLWLTASDPIAAAKAQAGAAGASFQGLKVSDGPFGGHATVRLQPPGETSEPIEINLTRPFWSRHWRSVSTGP